MTDAQNDAQLYELGRVDGIGQSIRFLAGCTTQLECVAALRRLLGSATPRKSALSKTALRAMIDDARGEGFCHGGVKGYEAAMRDMQAHFERLGGEWAARAAEELRGMNDVPGDPPDPMGRKTPKELRRALDLAMLTTASNAREIDRLRTEIDELHARLDVTDRVLTRKHLEAAAQICRKVALEVVAGDTPDIAVGAERCAAECLRVATGGAW